MAADYKQMEQNFRQFYDFSGKTVVGVGAGGGPFTDLVCEAKKLIVVDQDPAAIRQWEARIAARGLKDRFAASSDLRIISNFLTKCLPRAHWQCSARSDIVTPPRL